MNVFAVQCPNPRCKKYQLVEEHDRGLVVACLICRTAIKVGGGPPAPPAAAAVTTKKTPMPKK